MYVLVVEDDKFLGNAYRLKFEKEGFEVVITTDGQEAIDQMKKKMPDVVLLDLVMPVMDGFATLEAIRVTNGWKSVPVIVASNLGQKEDLDKAMAMGANDFVVKTNVSLDEIIAKVRASVAA